MDCGPAMSLQCHNLGEHLGNAGCGIKDFHTPVELASSARRQHAQAPLLPLKGLEIREVRRWLQSGDIAVLERRSIPPHREAGQFLVIPTQRQSAITGGVKEHDKELPCFSVWRN